MENEEINGIDKPTVNPVDTSTLFNKPIDTVQEVTPVLTIQEEEEKKLLEISTIKFFVDTLKGPAKASTFEKVKYTITEYKNPDKVEVTNEIKKLKISWILYIEGINENFYLIKNGVVQPVIKIKRDDGITYIPYFSVKFDTEKNTLEIVFSPLLAEKTIWIEAYGGSPSKDKKATVKTILDKLPELERVYWVDANYEKITSPISKYHTVYLCIESFKFKGDEITTYAYNRQTKTGEKKIITLKKAIEYIPYDFSKLQIEKENIITGHAWISSKCTHTGLPSRKAQSKIENQLRIVNTNMITEAFFARQVSEKKQVAKKAMFAPIEKARLGEKIYIVAKIILQNRNSLGHFRLEATLFDDNNKYLTQKLFTKEIEVAQGASKPDSKITFPRVNYDPETGYIWTEITLPDSTAKNVDTEKNPFSNIRLKVDLKIISTFFSREFYDKEGFKVGLEKYKEKSADIYFVIFETNGEIHYKINDAKRENVGYLFKDKTGEIFELAVFKLNKIEEKYGEPYLDKIIPKEKFIYLVDLGKTNDYFFYENKNKRFKYKINTVRTFINDVALASLFGAFLELQFSDILINGFSHKDGSSNPSSSHKNGMNGDLRYLKKDFSEAISDLFSNDEKIGWKSIDIIRQNQLNDALYKYGWKSMLSQYYNGTELFNHSVDDKDKNHNDHLHIQNFTPNLKIISNE